VVCAAAVAVFEDVLEALREDDPATTVAVDVDVLIVEGEGVEEGSTVVVVNFTTVPEILVALSEVVVLSG
jgi:hypothetical protein